MTVTPSQSDAFEPSTAATDAHVRDTAWPCQHCGFDGDQLSPSDAAAAARSLSRRWRELLCGIAEREPTGETLLHEPLGEGFSALDRAEAVAESFRRSAQHLAQIWGHDGPLLNDEDPVATSPGQHAAVLDDRVGTLNSTAEQLAEQISAFKGDDWARHGFLSGRRVVALQLAREAIHDSAHQLRLARDELALVCEHPVAEEHD